MNGRFTSNAEHSCVDAMCLVHIRECIKYHKKYSNPCNHDGRCCGEIETIPTAGRLIFNLDDGTKNAIDEAYKVNRAVADNYKNASVDQSKFCLTYEPEVMGFFKDGRTETVSCLTESSEFVKAIKNPAVTDSEGFKLLSDTCDRH
uniref:Choline/carnitine acyltransferase domain-containing protein n=1 Tax=Panagrolaimus davidi TaxID=227884 RepID=A0A914Q7H8_9BILA